MKVTVVDRETMNRTWGKGLHAMALKTVEIAENCPKCGARRSTPVKNRFYEDGEYYTVDVWLNACGHVDTYVAVLAEAALIEAMKDTAAVRQDIHHLTGIQAPAVKPSKPFTLEEFRASRIEVDLGVAFEDYGFEPGAPGFRYLCYAGDVFGMCMEKITAEDGSVRYGADVWGSYVSGGDLAKVEEELYKAMLDEVFPDAKVCL